MSHLEEFKIVSDIQHGFRKSYSCETQLSIALEDLAKNLDHGKQSDVICWTLLKLLILSHTNARLLSKLSVQDTINNCRFKLGRLENSLVSSLNGNTWEVFRFNAVIWVKGGAGGGGGSNARYDRHQNVEITHHSD